MTDPVINFSDVPDDPVPTIEAPAPRRRGRPRDPATIQRDADVLKILQTEGAQTRDQLVERFDVKPSLVYLALWRLRRAGQVERTSDDTARYVWRALS